MPKRQLDDDLLGKQETKTGKSKQYLREQISRKAGKFGVSSLAAQLIWAKQMGFGITQAPNRTSPEVREEVRSAQSPPPIRGGGHIAPGKNGRLKKGKPITGATIDTLLRDQ